MAGHVHLDTTAAHKALDELIEKVERIRAAAQHTDASDGVNPAKVAQALKRYNRRNGIAD